MKFTAIILASLASLTDALVMPGQSILQTMTGKSKWKGKIVIDFVRSGAAAFS